MENELFAILEEDAQDRSTHRACLRAVARANTQFSTFFKLAASDDDYMARFELVRDRVSDIVREACIEEGTTNLDIVAKVLAGELARLSEVERGTPQDVDVAPSEGEDEGNMHVRGLAGRKLLGLDDQEGESKTAAGVDTGDTYTQETVDLPKADDSGLSEDPSPKMDSASAGDENHTSQKPIDIPSTRHNPEVQDITDPADYTATLETPSGVAKRVDADSPMQPEHHVAPGTDSWTGTKDQANPVTSKWKVLT